MAAIDERARAAERKEWRIPLLPGDGVGPELAEVARLCVAAVNNVTGSNISLVDYPIGYSWYRSSGNALPAETLEAMRGSPVSLLAALSTKECPPPSVTGQMRKLLGLFTDIRHCISGPGSLRENVDLIMFRECSEGFLSDRNMYQGAGEFMPTPDMALSIRVVTREKCDQIARLAFEYARAHGRKKITAAHKEVVFSLSCGLFLECVQKQARNFPDVLLDDEWVDDLARNVVLHPERYDMILTTNLYGDILADVAAAQVGAIVPVINANNDNAVFYPIHAPFNDLAGKQRINPMVMARTISLMLHWLKLDNAGRIIDKALAACQDTTLEDFILPAGLTTVEVTESIVRSIHAQGDRS